MIFFDVKVFQLFIYEFNTLSLKEDEYKLCSKKNCKYLKLKDIRQHIHEVITDCLDC